MKTPKEFYKLSELAENRWKLTEDNILNLALAEKISISVFWDGPYWEDETGLFFDPPDQPRTKEKPRFHDYVRLDIKDIRLFLVPREYDKDKVEVSFGYNRSGQKISLIINHHPFLDVDGAPRTCTPAIDLPQKEGITVVYAPFFRRSELVILSEEVEKYEDANPHIIKNYQTDKYIKNGKDIINIDLINKVLDQTDNEWYSEPLAIAVTAWLELYAKKEGTRKNNKNRKKNGGNTALVEEWLEKHHPEIIEHPTTTGHYCFIINPSKQGGPGKTSE